MITGRMSGDSLSKNMIIQLHKGICGAPGFKSSDFLEILTFEEDFSVQ